MQSLRDISPAAAPLNENLLNAWQFLASSPVPLTRAVEKARRGERMPNSPEQPNSCAAEQNAVQ